MNINQYPFGPLPRRTILVGQKKGGRLRAELVRLAGIADRKRLSLRSEITPPLMSDEERGQGNTRNAQMHRLLHG